MSLHDLRFRAWPALAAMLLLPTIAAAQVAPATGSSDQPPPSSSVIGEGTSSLVDIGLRGTAFGSGADEARFQRYRDLRNGPAVDLFRYANEDDSRSLKVQADHVGYRDQHYSAAYNNFGKLKVSAEWNQTPLFFSRDTRTLFTSPSAGVLRIDDAIQSGIQNKTTTLANVVGQAQPFDLRLKRNVFDLKLTYSATSHLDWNVSFRNTTKDGSQPWAGTFGFGDAVELAVPVDTRTTEFGSSVEWANGRGMVRVGYDGSFFRNNVTTLTWDNPLRISDAPTGGPLQGRMSIWPNSNLNTISTTESLNLPLRSRVMAYLSVGNWSQDDPLIPFTINSALQAPSLDRATADAKARVTSMTYAFTSKPTDLLWFNVRYRSYDFDNNTPEFKVPTTVAYDTNVAAFAEGATSPYSLTRKTFDVDVSLTPTRYTKYAAFRVGYTRETIDQTFRLFDSTTEDTLRLSADTTGLNWLTLRGVFEHGKRVGSGFDEQVLDDIGEQVSLRQFDISDRTSDRFSLIAQVTPISSVGVNGTVSVGKEERPGAVFGLRSNENHAYSFGIDFVPRDAVSLGLSYQFEKYDALQASRQATRALFNDPTRDWTTDSADKARTLSASIDLLKLLPKTDIRVAYDRSRAESTYVYGLVPNSSLTTPVPLPTVVNELQRATLDLRYYLRPRVAIGGYYWYDAYSVNDFALSPQTLSTLAQPSFLILGYLYRPYSAHTVAARVTYAW